MSPLSEENLKSMIRCESVGDQWPYAGGSDKDIEKHLKKAVSKLKRLPRVALEAEFAHYGSGYASYVDVFCYPRDRSSQRERDGVADIEGISVYLSRLAPLSVLGSTERTKRMTGSSYEFLFADTVNSMPSGDWSEFIREIRSTITACGFMFLDRETALQPLPFEADIPTVLSEPPYTVFDAVFYWED